MKRLEEITIGASPASLRNPYLEWAEAEGVPIIEDFGVDLNGLEMRPWPRFGVDGAIVHLKGRGDFISVFRFDIRPGGKSAPLHHLYEQVVYVLSGNGSTTVEAGDGSSHTFEWAAGSMFALPTNVKHQHFNGSGREAARLSITNNLCVVMNLFRNADFIFGSDYEFVGKEYGASDFSGAGQYIPAPRDRAMWETNFVPSVEMAELLSDDKRGEGSATQIFILSDVGMHAHCAQMPVGTYKKAHRHGSDYHVMVIDGKGFSLFWYEGDRDFVRIDWEPGWMFAPPDQMYHQHFNTGSSVVRYMATAIGNSRYPFTERNRQGKLGVDVSVKDGGMQLEFEDQDPRVHEVYLSALAKNGVRCTMTNFPQPAASG